MDKSFKKNYLIFFVFCIVSFFVCAGNDEELFLRGNKYYKEADYENALASYDGIEKKGRAVWYNMGNCFYTMQDYTQAFVHWSRAERGAQYHERSDITRNKEHLLAMLGKLGTKTYIQKVYAYISACAYFVPLLILEIVFLLFWYLLFFFFYKGKNKVLCGAVCICLLYVGLLLHIQYKESSTLTGVVLQKVSLYAGPNTAFHVIASLSSIESVVVTDSRDGWYKIRYEDLIGWIKADAIQVI